MQYIYRSISISLIIFPRTYLSIMSAKARPPGPLTPSRSSARMAANLNKPLPATPYPDPPASPT